MWTLKKIRSYCPVIFFTEYIFFLQQSDFPRETFEGPKHEVLRRCLCAGYFKNVARRWALCLRKLINTTVSNCSGKIFKDWRFAIGSVVMITIIRNLFIIVICAQGSTVIQSGVLESRQDRKRVHTRQMCQHLKQMTRVFVVLWPQVECKSQTRQWHPWQSLDIWTIRTQLRWVKIRVSL